MTFIQLANILKKRNSSDGNRCNNDVAQEIIEEDKVITVESRARQLQQQLYPSYIEALNKRRDKWFEKHPNEQYFNPSLEECRSDTKLEEWLYYFISYLAQTPEQRYQNKKAHWYFHDKSIYMYNDDNGSDVRGCDADTGCIPKCRFFPAEGRIEILEVLEYFKGYDRYKEILEIWTEKE